MIIARTAIKISVIISRPKDEAIVLVRINWVVLSGEVELMNGVAEIIPLSTGSITTIRIATTMNAMIADMIICANAWFAHSFTDLRSMCCITSDALSKKGRGLSPPLMFT